MRDTRPESDAMAAKPKPSSFNETIAQLEALVTTLEDSNTSLEDSLAGYERGVQLLRKAQKELNDAEQKVQLLTEEFSNNSPDSSSEPT
ncbi:MAG: exodeoxyribonuclease VII small subunit [Parahaliea sp.]